MPPPSHPSSSSIAPRQTVNHHQITDQSPQESGFQSCSKETEGSAVRVPGIAEVTPLLRG